MARGVNEADQVFARESGMAGPVVRWMKRIGMTAVRSEFVTPWGICDLVGLAFNRGNCDHRIRLGQTRAIGSIIGATLLMQIPDEASGRSITREKLAREFAPTIAEEVVREQTDRLIAGNFVQSVSRGRLQRANGWYPLQDRLVSVELKLSRIEEAMRQALDNLGFAEESYVALPSAVALRVAASRARWSRFFDAGVGLLAVTSRICTVLVPACEARHLRDDVVQFYCVEKFWRTRLRDN